MLVCGRALSCRRRTLSINKLGLTFRLLSLWPHKKEFKRKILCQWQGSENCSDEVAQRTVNRILWGRDTCSHLKVEHCYWEKQWPSWHDRWHSFLWVWVSASKRIPLSVLAQNPHKRLGHNISYETRSQHGKAKSQSSQQKSEEGNSQKRWLPSKESANVRGWVSVPGGCVGILLGYTLAIAHRCTENHRKMS